MGIKKIPVSKRKDYIKEFETVVKQEIALHEKKVQETDQCLADFYRAIKSNKNQTFAKIHQLENYCTELRKHFDKTHVADLKFQAYEKNLKKLESSQQLLLEQLSKTKEDQKNFLQAKDLHSLKNNTDNMLSDYHVSVGEELNKVVSGIRKLKKELSVFVSKVEKDYLFLLDQQKSFQKTINEIKDEQKTISFNARWALDDMKKKQKNIFVLERKFEYLDDKIKKLEEKMP